MNSYQSLVERVLVPVGRSGKDVIYVCPHCDDKSGHLYIDYDRGYYNCFKCGEFKGRSLYTLLQYLGVDAGYDYESLDRETSKELDAILELKKSRKSVGIVDYSKDLLNVTRFYSQHTVPLSPQARDYLIRRGITDRMIFTLGIQEGISLYPNKWTVNGIEYQGRDYSGRIMIPSKLKDGRVAFYVARDYTGSKPNKYLNPPQDLCYASEDVWGLDLIESDHVVICEGVFTALAVDTACGKHVAVATYGKSISQRSNTSGDVIVTSQGEKLLNRKFKTYIVFYDKDAREETIKTAKYLYDRGANVRVVQILTDAYGPKADAADMTPTEVIKCISQSVPYDPLSEIFL